MKPFEARAARSDKDVRYGPARRPVTQDIVQEPISPELVLVDPELRHDLLAQQLEELLLEALPDSATRPPRSEPAPSPVEPAEQLPRSVAAMPPPVAAQHPGQSATGPRRRRRLSPALLSVSLAVNVIVIALSVSDARIAQTSPSSPQAIDPPAPDQLAPPRTQPPSTKKALRPSTNGTRTQPKSKPKAPKATVRVTRGKVEQQALNTVIQSPAKKLPPALINSRTGLAKNGLQAHCRRETRSSFWCVVGPARRKPGEGLYARYVVNRKGTGGAFTWFPYRRG